MDEIHPRRMRLDVAMVDRGIVPSRERARGLILAGQVRVDGHTVDKAGAPVEPTAVIALAGPDHPYVGRGGLKLAFALDRFGIEVSGREALDVGASTGGFTDVLLRRGARRVVALDVGHGQLDWRLRNDPRVVVLERYNARRIDLADLPGPVGVVTIDVSFISLRQILPRLPALMEDGADLVALVKPQFEAGRREVGRHGLVKDPGVWARVVDEVASAAAACGLVRAGLVPSPITGARGNHEFLLHLRPSRETP
jgi:23S rRNA (cytidine1920-2'-O)/16S rRNA (cytidine1409-2'-O)-methyltransferase